MKNRFLSLMVTTIFAICLFTNMFVVSAFAAEAPYGEEYFLPDENSVTTYEYETILQLKSMTDAELKAAGYTQKNIDVLKEFNFEEALLERAALSKEQLTAMGYSDKEIALLKQYDGSPLTASSPVLAATAKCTGSIRFISYSETGGTGYLKFRYTFQWNVAPLCLLSDQIALSWRGINPAGSKLECSVSYSQVFIQYYRLLAGDYVDFYLSSGSPMVGFDGYCKGFPMTKDVTPENEYDSDLTAWAKNGMITVELYSDGTDPINKVKVYGAVGHRSASVENLTYSAGADGYSFTFTPAIKCDTVAAIFRTVFPNGSVISN